MNPVESDRFLKSLCMMYETAGLPNAILDEAFCVQWCSSAAEKALPGLKLPGGLDALLGGRDPAQIKEEIAARGVFTIDDGGGLFPERAVAICALPKGLPGYYLLQAPAPPDQGSPRQPKGLSRPLSSFDNQYRVPITGIFAVLSKLAREAREQGGPEGARFLSYLEEINRNTYLLMRNCNLILEYTRLSNGLSPLRPEPLDIYGCLDDLLASCAEITGQSGIPLSYELPKGCLVVQCDREKLVRSLLCLLSNACRYTREGNEIRVRVRRLANTLSVKVSDRGAGIPADVLPHVWEPYYSYSRDGTPFTGNGLGLPYAKESVLAMGGAITLSSEDGAGTAVTFTLPIRTEGESGAPLTLESSRFDPETYLSNRFSEPWVLLADGVRCPLGS